MLSVVSLSGCIDNNYDLSDLDTTTEIKVKDLVLPLNLEAVKLGDIISIKEGSEFQEVTLNGETFYAVNKSGSFSSDRIYIPGFSAPAPVLQNSVLEFAVPGAKASVLDFSLPLRNPIERAVSYKATGIDPAILSVDGLSVEDYTITLEFIDIPQSDGITRLSLDDIQILLPKGLKIKQTVPADAVYDSSTGYLTIPSVNLKEGRNTVGLTASAVSLSENGCGIDYDSHSLDFHTAVNIENATLNVSVDPDRLTSLPSSSIGIKYTLSPISAKAFSGEIEYRLVGSGLHISPVSLDDLPDFLAGDETNIVLANPQIYVSLNNPVASEGLTYRSGISLSPVRDGVTGGSFTLDDGFFSVGHAEGEAGPYNFCLSPEAPGNTVPEEFSNGLKHERFSSLGGIVSGKGLPDAIDISLVNPEIPSQKVEDFTLGHYLPALEGRWRLLAPLALKGGSDGGSVIVYTERKDGWNDPDVDAITIETLEVTAVVDNDLPLSAVIAGYPLGKDGRRIDGVEITGAKVEASTGGQQITIRVTGTVRHLDGIEFTATVHPGSDSVLSPDQTITLRDIRARVTGSYVKEL